MLSESVSSRVISYGVGKATTLSIYVRDKDLKSFTRQCKFDVPTTIPEDFVLTEEERSKLVEANEIKLTQVEVLDIASITTVKPERESFAGKIHEYTLSGSKTTISFPASGFKADMIGMTYGEIGDISLSMDSVTVDKYYKRLAIIYNKMKNISSGPFDSFESFFAQVFGLLTCYCSGLAIWMLRGNPSAGTFVDNTDEGIIDPVSIFEGKYSGHLYIRE